MTELEEVTKIVAQKKNITNPKKPIHVLRFDEKEDTKLPIIHNGDYIGFARAMVENIVLVYEIVPDRDIGCFSYTYQGSTGFTLPCDRVYHIPHNKEDTLCRRIYKNIITNSAYKDDEDLAYDILDLWRELRQLKDDYVILHTPILFHNRSDLFKVIDMMKKSASSFPIGRSRPVAIDFEGKV